MNLVCKGAASFVSIVSEAVDLVRGSSKALSAEVMIFPEGGVEGWGVEFLIPWRYRTILAIFPGFEERVIMVVTPAEVARRAATILVDIPPVPRLDPGLDTTLTLVNINPSQ